MYQGHKNGGVSLSSLSTSDGLKLHRFSFTYVWHSAITINLVPPVQQLSAKILSKPSDQLSSLVAESKTLKEKSFCNNSESDCLLKCSSWETLLISSCLPISLSVLRSKNNDFIYSS